MHTLILCGFSAMLKTCLRGKWRSTKRKACRQLSPTLALSRTHSLPLHQPLSLFNSVYKNKKVKKTQSSAASKHKKSQTTLHSRLRWRIRNLQYVYVRSILFAVCPLCSLCIHNARASPSRNNNKYVNEFA